jgi:CHASE2 domain-containing sensor protein
MCAMRSVTGPPSFLAALSPWAYFRHSWRAVFAVTALVSIAHDFHVLDPIETYAFFVVSHFLEQPSPHAVSPRVVVASIDQVSFESDYRERSPLRRSVLYRHLKTVYELRPSVVVVDLDLSPVLPLSSPDEGAEGATEERLESKYQKMIEDLMVEGLKNDRPTKTVLMRPFSMTTESADQASKAWQQSMEARGVEFGDASLPITWGVTIQHRCAANSLAALAYVAALPKPSHRPNASCLDGDGESTNTAFIIPSHYAHIEKVPIVLQGAPPFERRLTLALASIPNAVVFFGGGWGESDTHLTPAGELYGVEVHAGTYLSIANPPRPMTGLADDLLDIIVASVVGAFLSFFWRKYFSDVLGASPIRREHAVLWLLALGAITIAFIAAFVAVSFQLLRWGLWLSPVGLIVGMSIHTFVESLREARVGAFRRTVVETSPHVVESVEEAAWVAPDDARSPNSTSLWRLVYQYFWVDARAMYRLDEPDAHCAAALLFVKRLGWLVLVVVGLFLILPLKKEALMRLLTSALLVAVLIAPSQAAESSCRGLPPTLRKDDLSIWEKQTRAGGPACGSFLSVIGKLMGRDVTAGRRLETDRPFNPAAAQANVEKALRDPAVRKRIEALRRDVLDETVRLMYEAVVFDEEGYYDARELRIQQLRQRLN